MIAEQDDRALLLHPATDVDDKSGVGAIADEIAENDVPLRAETACMG